MCYIVAGKMRLVATALFERSERLQDDLRPLARKNSKQLGKLATFFWQRQSRGSLSLPPGLSLDEQVDTVKLIRDTILAECARHRAGAREEKANALHTAVNLLLSANLVAGSFVVAQEEVEEAFHGHLACAEGGSLHEVESDHQLESMGAPALC